MIWISILALAQVTLPTEIRGEPGSFVPVRAETQGELVRFVALDSGLQVFPGGLLADKKATVVIAPRSGRYRLLAYSAISGVPTEPVVVLVVIGDGSPTPPAPPMPPMPEADKLRDALTGIYGGHVEPDKARKTRLLSQVYTRGATLSRDPAIGTTSALLAALVSERGKSDLRAGDITPIRERIAAEWSDRLGDADQSMTLELRDRASALCTRIAAILGELAHE